MSNLKNVSPDGKNYLVKKAENISDISVTVPGSKSITNRALLIAALADGKSRISGVLFSDDSRNFLKALQDLGFTVKVWEEECIVEITGLGGRIPRKEASVYVGSAGTAARFLTALLGMSDGSYEMLSSDQMKKRPMQELLESLEELGAEVRCMEQVWHFPYVIGNKTGLNADHVTVDVDKSSQFLSALLISSVLFDHDFTIQVAGSHGMAYVEMTVKMMAQFGVKVERISEKEFLIPACSAYQARDYQVEPDLSAACYFYGIGAVLGVPAMVKGVHSESMQGDIRFLDVLCDMGCSREEKQEGITLYPADKQTLRGGSWDLSAFSDQALTLAAIAPFCSTSVEIKGISHIRFQECDRISAITTNLDAMGINCREFGTGVTIEPGDVKAELIRTYDDHRVAMSFTIPGLAAGGMEIENYLCCRKTFENYFQILEQVLY